MVQKLSLVGLLLFVALLYLTQTRCFLHFFKTTEAHNRNNNSSTINNSNMRNASRGSAPYSMDIIAKFENDYSEHDDPELAEFIYHKWIATPSHQPISLQGPETIRHSQFNQAKIVDKLLKHKTGNH